MRKHKKSNIYGVNAYFYCLSCCSSWLCVRHYYRGVLDPTSAPTSFFLPPRKHLFIFFLSFSLPASCESNCVNKRAWNYYFIFIISVWFSFLVKIRTGTFIRFEEKIMWGFLQVSLRNFSFVEFSMKFEINFIKEYRNAFVFELEKEGRILMK
jgi:hypothetical protein